MADYCLNCMTPLHGNTRCPNCYTPANGIISQAHQLPAGSILRERYLVGRVLGNGAFGITYLGMDLFLERIVAIKEYYPSAYAHRVNSVSSFVTLTDADLFFVANGKEKFIQEAKVLAAFRETPAIVDVFDYFEENGTAYIVMEYLSGRNLKQVLETYRFSANEIFSLLAPVMDALSVVHQHNVIHRDISPDNLMLRDDGSLVLMDFGAARQLQENGDQSLTIMLKRGYAPEEQYFSRGNVGPWTDVYALCATIYHCITGVRPPESIERFHVDDLQPPSSFGIPISAAQEKALMRGLSVAVLDRIQSMDELKAALKIKSTDIIQKKNKKKTTPELDTDVEVDSGNRKRILIAVLVITAILLIALVPIAVLLNTSAKSQPAHTAAPSLSPDIEIISTENESTPASPIDLNAADLLEPDSTAQLELTMFDKRILSGTELVLTWDFTGEAPEYWAITYGAGFDKKQIVKIRGKTYTLTNLTPGALYSITISASGTADAVSSEIQVKMPAGDSSTAANISIDTINTSAAEDGTISIYWTYSGGMPTEWQLMIRPLFSEDKHYYTATKNSYVFAGIPNTDYEIMIISADGFFLPENSTIVPCAPVPSFSGFNISVDSFDLYKNGSIISGSMRATVDASTVGRTVDALYIIRNSKGVPEKAYYDQITIPDYVFDLDFTFPANFTSSYAYSVELYFDGGFLISSTVS